MKERHRAPLPYAVPYVDGEDQRLPVDRERRRLAELSRRLGRSQSEVIRAAIIDYDPGPDDDRAFTLSGIVDGPGDSMADLDADLLLRGFGE